jgi:hypothetical protein
MEKTDINIQELQDFFFRASINGYASGKEPDYLQGFPGAKFYLWYEEIKGKAYRYKDMYFSVGNGKSFGFTLISISGQLVWYMRYWGESLKKFVGEIKVTDVLKKALLDAYQRKSFLGGRGTPNFIIRYLDYHNVPQKNLFEEFYGEDMIHDETPNRYPEKIFLHKYEGGLIPK